MVIKKFQQKRFPWKWIFSVHFSIHTNNSSRYFPESKSLKKLSIQVVCWPGFTINSKSKASINYLILPIQILSNKHITWLVLKTKQNMNALTDTRVSTLQNKFPRENFNYRTFISSFQMNYLEYRLAGSILNWSCVKNRITIFSEFVWVCSYRTGQITIKQSRVHSSSYNANCVIIISN